MKKITETEEVLVHPLYNGLKEEAAGLAKQRIADLKTMARLEAKIEALKAAEDKLSAIRQAAAVLAGALPESGAQGDAFWNSFERLQEAIK